MTFHRAALAAIALSLASHPARSQASEPVRREIVVSGTGEAHAAPDMASATFAVLRGARTAREALDQANTAMAKVIEGMKALGVEARDVQTSGFGITPQYRYDNDGNGDQKPPELIGYEVRNGLGVRIRDVGRIGEILDRAVTLGVNSGGDIAFDIDDPTALRIDARRKAVRDATATARALAEAAGVPLGPVVRIDVADDAIPPPPMPMARMAMDAAPAPKSSVPVETGESTIRASVTMTFAIGAADGR